MAGSTAGARCGAAAQAETGIDALKAALRDGMKALRTSVPAGERAAADARIRSRVLGLPAFRQAHVVFSYLSFGSEVDTRGIIGAAWADGKAVALPRCSGPRQMRWFRVASFDGLERSPFGMLEPRDDPAREVDPAGGAGALALVPGLSFDGEGYRLGYGGGYYDAFLAGFSGTAVGLCRSAQLSDVPLPRGSYDEPVGIVVTDGPDAPWLSPAESGPELRACYHSGDGFA